MSKGKVLLGMSGGVDSSVAAVMLKEQGYDIIGCTMKLWQCENISDDAKRVCDLLEIPHHVFDFTKEFKEKVIDTFVNSYLARRNTKPMHRM